MALQKLRKTKKTALHRAVFLLRGSERIRTAVGAFAELSLATRPRNQKMKASAFGFQTSKDIRSSPIAKAPGLH